jgi:heme/copper-type cytochrome/quinol oxidase subunit 4
MEAEERATIRTGVAAKKKNMEADKAAGYRMGIIVLVALAVLTGIEYYVAFLPNGATTILFVIALAKAWAILKYFMHVTSLWSKEGEH